MDRDRVLILIAVPIIGFAAILLWKEYGEYYGKPPVVQLPDVAQLAPASLSASKSAVDTSSSNSTGRAAEEIPKGRTAEQATVIARAKNTSASALDSSLPHQSVSDWMAGTAGGSARIRWEVNDCGEAAREPGTLPVCAQANIDFSDGTSFQAALLMGTRTAKSHNVQFADPSLMWAVYSKSGSDALTPAPLSALTRIAQSAN